MPAYFDSDWGKLFLENSESGFKEDTSNFLQTSENYFNPPTGQEKLERINENLDEKNNENKTNTRTTLPPISQPKRFESSSMEKKGKKQNQKSLKKKNMKNN